MSIEKKSLISTLKTTKKANVASAPATFKGEVHADHTISKSRVVSKKTVSKKTVSKRQLGSRRSMY